MPVSQLQYRLYTDKDLQGVLDLWEKHSGWGGITKEDFNTWYMNTPYGPCIVIVAVEGEDNIVGQVVFIPCVIYQNGKLIKGLKVSSPILNDQARDSNIKSYDHPVFAMFRHGAQIAKSNGYEIVYMFPSKGWTSVLKLFPRYGLPEVYIGLYDCFGLSLENGLYQPGKDISIAIAEKSFTEDFDQLWIDATDQFPISCAVQRNATWLQWKIAGHLVFEARNVITSQLAGYICINKKSGLIVDMLARTKKELSEVIKSLINFLHFSNPERYPIQIRKLTGMLIPSMQSVLENIPFQKEDFTFAFGCYSLQNSVSFQSISPPNWYMMPND